MKSDKICLIGQVMVDVTLIGRSENKLRLGGVFHAARALWALGLDYTLAFCAPRYLLRLIEEFSKEVGSPELIFLGEVSKAPNVILISEATEAGPQGYELLLRESSTTALRAESLEQLQNGEYADVLLFPGGYELEPVLRVLAGASSKVYVDVAYDFENLEELKALGRKFESIVLSTSSELFLETFNGDVKKLAGVILEEHAESFLFKENRGGARFFSSAEPITVGAQVRAILHSVGVGDCYNVVFAVMRRKYTDREAMSCASFVAAEYASTTYPDDFKKSVGGLLSLGPTELSNADGVEVAWEDRPLISIYIAAPDFDYMNREPIDAVDKALRYHNFSPHRPILENGQVHPSDSQQRRFEIHSLDMKLLGECNLLVAVLLDNDPGTFIEIGLASASGIPVIVYDPFRLASNLMLQQLPTKLTHELDEVIGSVFINAAKIVKKT